jgi:hypothetical protein
VATYDGKTERESSSRPSRDDQPPLVGIAGPPERARRSDCSNGSEERHELQD